MQAANACCPRSLLARDLRETALLAQIRCPAWARKPPLLRVLAAVVCLDTLAAVLLSKSLVQAIGWQGSPDAPGGASACSGAQIVQDPSVRGGL
eukprot:CAMPEP_0171162486 /NCGR_PEP_ID=MMETSP0790-20130122/4616_1 /TAXON_ID=2925 /ORGANISM="Alexandrium catenella, Strain OF101" /LENGTH=93 /DNA_ID=CAMNT_0011627089 /DNA_START=459 /DNA_END=737 /DNA_ORIENTATION=+